MRRDRRGGQRRGGSPRGERRNRRGGNGEGGIRTLERGQPPLRDFQSRPFNRSGTSPGPSSSARGRPTEGYDTGARMRLLGCASMLVAASEAFSKTFGLAVTFGGIGVIVG